MPYNLLLFPLLGGFLFLHINHFSRFHAQRLDGYRMLVESAIAGTGLGVLGRLIVVWSGGTRLGTWSGLLWFRLLPWPHSDTAAWGLTLGPVLALLLNLFINREKAKDIEIHRHASSFARLLHEAEQQERPISITLDTRKWYIGYVAESPNLDPQETYFRLLPVISGYRDKDTLETFRTVFYEEVYRDPECDSEDFVITIPIKDVKIANFFDMELYEQYFAEDDDDDAEDGTANSPKAEGKVGPKFSLTQVWSTG